MKTLPIARSFRLWGAPVVALAVLALLLAPGASAQETGSADFSRFVTLGDSLGAGFADGGLVETYQRNSTPALIAEQAGVTGFEQPLVSPPGIPSLLELRSLQPLVIAPEPGSGQPLNLNLPRPYDNLSVPGYQLGDALRDRERDGIDALILRTPNTQLEQAAALQPTFALVWLGNNDVLGAATSGIAIDGVTLTPRAQFAADYNAVLGTLKGLGADLAVATIPDVTSIPFVSTIPPVVVNPATSQPVLGPNGQPIPLLGPGGVPLGAGDRVLLSASGALAQGIGIPAAVGGTGQGLPDNLVLSEAEVGAIQARTDEFNDIIRQAAAANGAAVADLNAVLREAATDGIDIGGIDFTPEFLTGGIFSYDGVHPNAFGYAYIANVFIDAINETYGAAIPLVDLFPFVFGPQVRAIPLEADLSEIIFTPEAAAQVIWSTGGDRALLPPPPAGGGDTGGQGDGGGGDDPDRPGGGDGFSPPRAGGDDGPGPSGSGDGPLAGDRPGRGGRG